MTFVCTRQSSCPHVESLTASIKKMEDLMAVANKTIATLRENVAILEQENLLLKKKGNERRKKRFKPNLPDKQSNKKGPPKGHIGHGRPAPTVIEKHVDIYPEKCNHCGNPNITVYEDHFKQHRIQDIQIQVISTCYRKHSGYCPVCKKTIIPSETENVIPNSRIGTTARAIAGFLEHLGIPLKKRQSIFKDVFGLTLSHPSFINFEDIMAKRGFPLYQSLQDSVANSDNVHVDETGWRINGRNCWLWTFVNNNAAFYRIDSTRGSDVVKDILGESYDGILSSDFYSAYNPIHAKGKQKCIPHLLVDIKNIQETSLIDTSCADFVALQNLKTIFKQSIAIHTAFKNNLVTQKDLISFKNLLIPELVNFVSFPSCNDDVLRIQHRIVKHNKELLLFLDNPSVDPTNNLAERMLRPSVIIRKISHGNRSEKGALNHSIIMSIVQTAILNNKQPFSIFLSLASNSKDISDIIKPP